MYGLLANLVAMIHGTLVVCVVCGGIAILAGRLRHRKAQAAYLGLLAGLGLSQIILGQCFLTGWEKTLRDTAQPGSAYTGPFISHYLPFIPAQVAYYAGFGLGAAVVLTIAWQERKRYERRKAK